MPPPTPACALLEILAPPKNVADGHGHRACTGVALEGRNSKNMFLANKHGLAAVVLLEPVGLLEFFAMLFLIAIAALARRLRELCIGTIPRAMRATAIVTLRLASARRCQHSRWELALWPRLEHAAGCALEGCSDPEPSLPRCK